MNDLMRCVALGWYFLMHSDLALLHGMAWKMFGICCIAMGIGIWHGRCVTMVDDQVFRIHTHNSIL